jgi:PII-like signaling protein
MATRPVTVARIFLREGEHVLTEIIRFLHDEHRVAGLTVVRGIAGFGPDGKVHSASLMDLSLDLPLIVEFYDEPERVEAMLSGLQAHTAVTHVVSWSALVHHSDV